MLKRIHVQQLSLGMYLHELCGSWMEHPFWRTRFLLEDPQDLLRIRETSIQEVLIDISKGLDLANAATAQAEGEVSEAPRRRRCRQSRYRQSRRRPPHPWRRSCSAPPAFAPTPSRP